MFLTWIDIKKLNVNNPIFFITKKIITIILSEHLFLAFKLYQFMLYAFFCIFYVYVCGTNTGLSKSPADSKDTLPLETSTSAFSREMVQDPILGALWRKILTRAGNLW